MKSAYPLNHSQGFTLIELLVVIAVLGILAAVVMVAINPGQRTNEANDVKNKSEVGQVARALENYFTNNLGTYTGADSTSLVNLKYLKRWPGSVTLNVTATESSASAALTAASASCGRGSGSFKYWCYSTFDGLTVVLCRASAGTPDTRCTS